MFLALSVDSATSSNVSGSVADEMMHFNVNAILVNVIFECIWQAVFNPFDKRVARFMHRTISWERRVASQRSPTKINKTGVIAKVRTLVEQVIGHLKRAIPKLFALHANAIYFYSYLQCLAQIFKRPMYFIVRKFRRQKIYWFRDFFVKFDSANFRYLKFAQTHPMPRIWLALDQWEYITFQERCLGTFNFWKNQFSHIFTNAPRKLAKINWFKNGSRCQGRKTVVLAVKSVS